LTAVREEIQIHGVVWAGQVWSVTCRPK